MPDEDEMHELEILCLLAEECFDENTCTKKFIQQVVEQAPKAISIIEKQQKEIEELKEQFAIVDNECSRLEKIDIEKDLALQKKDKIIDLMCDYIDCLDLNAVSEDCINCKECLKQYFEKEAENGR